MPSEPERGEVGDAYAGCRGRIGALVGSLDDSQAATRVPACPEWAVGDVVAHLAGVVDDAMAGRLDGVTTEPWTAAQVTARRGRPITALMAEWDGAAPAFEAILDAIGPPGRQAVADVVTHEHDIRGALGLAGARDSDAVHIGFGFVAGVFLAMAGAGGLTLRVSSTDGEVFGDVDADVAVRAPAFELLRAMTGRRSEAQLVALDWHGDPTRALPAFSFGPFRPARLPIHE